MYDFLQKIKEHINQPDFATNLLTTDNTGDKNTGDMAAWLNSFHALGIYDGPEYQKLLSIALQIV